MEKNRTNSKRDRGVALFMIMSSVVILTTILAAFTYNTQINQIRGHNYQEKIQARLNAEAGLNFCLAKLRIYQEAKNKLAKNKRLKAFIKPTMLEEMLTKLPFKYPPPNFSSDEDKSEEGLIQKTAREKFMKDSFFQGEINASIAVIRGFINPNSMRVIIKPKKTDKGKNKGGTKKEEEKEEEEVKRPIWEIVDEKLSEIIAKAIEEEIEKTPADEYKYNDLDPSLLVRELAFYVNSEESFNAPEKQQIQALYSERGITPKHAPLTSIDELYLLEGWPSAIVDLIKDQLSVHENSAISVNEITKFQLEALFPELDQELVEEFFRYRDGDHKAEIDPSPFESIAEFKAYMIDEMGIKENDYEEIVKTLKQANLAFMTTGKLYRIVSEGRFNRTSYKITATVSLPVAKTKRNQNLLDRQRNSFNRGRPRPIKDKNPPPKKKTGPEKLLPPRIVELRLN